MVTILMFFLLRVSPEWEYDSDHIFRGSDELLSGCWVGRDEGPSLQMPMTGSFWSLRIVN